MLWVLARVSLNVVVDTANNLTVIDELPSAIIVMNKAVIWVLLLESSFPVSFLFGFLGEFLHLFIRLDVT